MSITRDYYEILGISRDSDETQIKKAFRRLARELHPDVNAHDPDAEEKFKEAAEAYEVLSDPERRQLYDTYGHEGLKSGGYAPNFGDFGSVSDIFSAFFGSGGFDSVFGTGRQAAPNQGEDIVVGVEIELVEAAHGVQKSIGFDVAEHCETCHGLGGKELQNCSRCNGTGQVQTAVQTHFGRIVRSAACAACQGVGQIAKEKCGDCKGRGTVRSSRTLDVDIPHGIADGQQIRLTGRGHAGIKGGPNGDLYVTVRVREDERWVRFGDDLLTVVDIASPLAALGTTVQIPTLDGEVPLNIPAGTLSGSEIKLRGKGILPLNGGRTGDIRVVVNVATLQNLSREQKEMLESLIETLGPENIRTKETLIDKLKRIWKGD
jgi:molecular chaperone DnaJ